MYSGESPAPLVLNFHGWTQINDDFMTLSDFRPFADTSGFILVYPQGAVSNGFTHWNVGTSNVDDIGFTNAMLDQIISGYNIDTTRVYSTGYSNGGYMSYYLASVLSHRFAAIAPVKGKMNEIMYSEFNCEHQMPILAINNTADIMVSYYDDPAVDVGINHWVEYNHCESDPDITELPDIFPNDGIEVERIVFSNGDNGSNVEMIRENDSNVGWGHDYPTSDAQNLWYFDSPTEIWEFFSRYDINGLIEPSGIEGPKDHVIGKFELSANYPNPFNPSTTIKYSIPRTDFFTLSIYNVKGSLIDVLMNGVQQSGSHEVTFDGSKLASGVYLYQLKSVDQSVTRKMLLIK